MPHFSLLNLTGLPLTIEPDPTSSSTFSRSVVAYITDQNLPDRVVRATIPLRRSRHHLSQWHEISLDVTWDRSSIRTDKVPLLDKVIEAGTGTNQDLRYKAFWKQVSQSIFHLLLHHSLTEMTFRNALDGPEETPR